MINWGGLVLSNQSYSEMLDLARCLDEWGFTSFWYPDEKFYRDCYIGLALAASQTSHIRLGPCVTDPYSHHPIQIAVSIGSLAEIAPGRVVLGIGAGGRGLVELGLRQNRPATAIRESVEIVRRLLAGESVDYSGQVLALKNLPLDFQPPPNIPIMIATGHGPYVQLLSGEIADIVMLANYASPETIIIATRQVEKGASKVNRTISEIEMIARLDVAIAEDAEQARKAVTPRILSALRSSYPTLNYLDVLPEFELPSRLIQVMQKKDHKTKSYYANPENSAPLIPSILTEHLAVAGTPAEVAVRLRSIIALGIFTEITISPVVCPGQTQEQVFRTFTEKVIPKI